MSNDIHKYRVWDVRKERYLNTDNVIVDADGICYQFNATCKRFDLIQYDVIVERCIGMKDKCGTLIYEGDLLGKSKDDDEFVEICWCDTLASFMCDTYPETYGNLESCDEEYFAKLEIIGNIHEMEVTE